MTRRHTSRVARPLAVGAALALVLAIPQPALASGEIDMTSGEIDVTSTDDYVIVQFRDPPAASHVDEVPGHQRTRPAPGEQLNPRAGEVRAYVAHLRGHQQEFRDWLAQRHPRAQVVADFQLTANAVAVERNGVPVQQLRRGPGAVDVQPVALYQPDMNASVDLINAGGLWDTVAGGRDQAGAGINVAVLDTGIDYGHPFFGCKDDDVVQRLYYSGEVADPALPPPPEGAPADMWSSHGTHVAGTIAGCVSTLPDGQTWSGVAPAAAVHDYNVFPARGVGYAAFGGSAFSHDIAAAIEDAVVDGMHVANLSLGGTQRGPNDFLDQAVNAAVAAGMTVVISAGNAGPGDSTVSSPGSAEDAITVAAATNTQIEGVEVTVAGTGYLAATGNVGVDDVAVAGTLVDWADRAGGDTLACAPIASGTFGEDEVALIARGVCTFTTKVRHAEQAGAGAVLMYNNAAGPPSALVPDGTPNPGIPAVMVSADDGAELRGVVPAAVTIPETRTATLVADPDFGNIIAGFSSRGPTPHGARLKPEVTAPGVNILSTVFQTDDGNMGFSSGTSMSSPHIAGAAAALLALHPDWTPADVKSAIVNTADPTAVTDHVTATEDPGLLARGAGLADLGAATAAPVTLHPATFGFGAWQGNRQVADDRQVTIRNVTDSAVTCSLSVDADIVGLSTTGINLGAGETANVTVELNAGNHHVTPTGDYDGSVTVNCGDAGELHAPWFVRIERSSG